MTVKDLILAHTAEDMYSIYLGMYYAEGYDARKRERGRHNFCEFYSKLKDIELVSSDGIILVCQSYSDGHRVLEAPLFYKEEIETDFDINSPLKDINIAEVESISNENIQKIVQNSSLPQCYSYELLLWEETLGFEVSETNIQSVGSLQALSAILYELSFFGYDEESKKEECKKLDEALKEVEQIANLPPEEQHKHTKTLEEVFGNFGIEDIRTEDEKEAFHRQICVDNLRTIIERYNVLVAYYREQET